MSFQNYQMNFGKELIIFNIIDCLINSIDFGNDFLQIYFKISRHLDLLELDMQKINQRICCKAKIATINFPTTPVSFIRF